MLLQNIGPLFEVGVGLHLGFSALEVSGGHRERSLERRIGSLSQGTDGDREAVRHAFDSARRELWIWQGWMIRIAIGFAVANAVALIITCVAVDEQLEWPWLAAAIAVTLVPLPAMYAFLALTQKRLFDQVCATLHRRSDRAGLSAEQGSL